MSGCTSLPGSSLVIVLSDVLLSLTCYFLSAMTNRSGNDLVTHIGVQAQDLRSGKESENTLGCAQPSLYGSVIHLTAK